MVDQVATGTHAIVQQASPTPPAAPPPPATEPQPEPPPEPEAASQPEPEPEPQPVVEPGVADGVSLNSASYEQLREVGMSVTQTGRVLSFREKAGGFKSLDELDSIPGFPQDFLDDLKTRISL